MADLLFMVFRQVQEFQVDELLRTTDEAQLRTVIETVFPQESPIVYDFHILNYQFARDHGFSSEKISVWLELMSDLMHESLDHRYTVSEAFDRFRQNLLQHSIQRPPISIAVFTLEDVKEASDFTLKTFCRHLSLYQHIFTPHIEISLDRAELFKTVFPPVLPLAEGKLQDPLSVNTLEEYVEHPAPVETAEDKGDDSEGIEVVLEPAKQLLMDELEKLKREMEEALKLQDEAFAAKLHSIKK